MSDTILEYCLLAAVYRMILDIVIVLSSWFVHREDFSWKARSWCRSWNTSNFETLNVTQPLEAAKLGRNLTTRIAAQSFCVRRLRSCRPVDTRHLGLYILSMRLFHNNRNTLLHTLYTLSLYLSDTHWLILCLQASFVKEDGKTFSTSMTHNILYAFPLVVGFCGCQLMLTHRN